MHSRQCTVAPRCLPPCLVIPAKGFSGKSRSCPESVALFETPKIRGQSKIDHHGSFPREAIRGLGYKKADDRLQITEGSAPPLFIKRNAWEARTKSIEDPGLPAYGGKPG